MATARQVQAVAARHQRARRSLATKVARQLDRLWTGVDSGSIASSWVRRVPKAEELLSAAQLASAESAQPYTDELAELYGIGGAAVEVQPEAFAEAASDGRELASLLYQPVVATLRAIKRGESPVRALTMGRFSLTRIVRTQVADAGRVADGVALVARPQLDGWVRMVNLPACSRCLILAGRFYRWDSGFARHDLCDCTHIPASEDVQGDLRTNPTAAFNSMTREEQDKSFGVNAARAIRDGADMNRVVNAGRSTYTAGGRKYTRDSTTRRGANRKIRLTPEQIYKEADGDRGEAIRLLRLHRYVL